MTQATADSVWADVSAVSTIDLSDIESVFSLASSSSNEPIKGKTPLAKTIATVIGHNRAQNIAIMLSRFRMSHSAIRAAVIAIDDSHLSVDNLKSLRQYTPTDDEVGRGAHVFLDFH